MNSQSFIQLDPKNQEQVEFYDLPEAHFELFCKYMDTGRHLQEVQQLFGMMRFNLDQIYKQYDLRFNDCIYSLDGAPVDMIQLNALICNAVSSARTLIESMEVFDKALIDSQEHFHKNYTAKVYDASYSYRIIDMLRNYMQHGHVPVSYDGERIFFNLSEILDVKHMNMNKKLVEKLDNIRTEIVESGSEARLTCVSMLYEYFLDVYNLYSGFYSYIQWDMEKLASDVKTVLQEHPDYIKNTNGFPFVAVYADDNGIVHGFSSQDDFGIMFEQFKQKAESAFENYKRNNHHLIRLEITYCLENRIPSICFVGDDQYSENLVDFCMRTGEGITHISFDTYYGKMMMHSIYRLFPYIQFEDGMRWNVPYREVQIADFLRTFPETREEGIRVHANNVGGAGALVDFLLREWGHFIAHAQYILQALGIHSWVDVLDWISRVTFVWQGMKWLRHSFASNREDKPTVQFLCGYVRRQQEWNVLDMAKNLHADKELLTLVLESLGYVSLDGVTYTYDEDIAHRLEENHKLEEKKLVCNYGTNIDCQKLNLELGHVNQNFLYLAALLMEHEQLERYEDIAQECLAPLDNYDSFVCWDSEMRELHVMEPLPDDFDDIMAEKIQNVLEEVDSRVDGRCKCLE